MLAFLYNKKAGISFRPLCHTLQRTNQNRTDALKIPEALSPACHQLWGHGWRLQPGIPPGGWQACLARGNGMQQGVPQRGSIAWFFDPDRPGPHPSKSGNGPSSRLLPRNETTSPFSSLFEVPEAQSASTQVTRPARTVLRSPPMLMPLLLQVLSFSTDPSFQFRLLAQLGR